MNDDLKKNLDKLAQELGPYTSNTNTILRAINDLSEKMDESQQQEEIKQKKQSRKDTVFFVISTVIGLLTLGATVLFGITG